MLLLSESSLGSPNGVKRNLGVIRESLEEEKVPEANPRQVHKKIKFHEVARKSSTHRNLLFNNKLVHNRQVSQINENSNENGSS
jgi:hypothetical protein